MLKKHLKIKMMLQTFKEKIDHWHFGILGLIFALALTVRLLGVDWGMPHNNLHPDEGIIFVPAYECALNHNFEVHEYYRPNHVSIKLNTLLYVGIQELYFAPQGEMDFALNYSEHFALFTTASRVLMALFSMGVVILAYAIARLWGKNQALFATFLFAVFPSFIEHSHYITPDITLLFFLMGVLWAALCYLRKPSLSWLFWMSFFTALAVCEKYPGAYGCAIIAAVVCIARLKKPVMILRDGLLAIFFLILGILAVSPILLIDFRTVLDVIGGQNRQYHLGADGLNFGQTFLFYAKTAAVHMGLILTISSIYGIVRSIKKKTKEALVLVAFLTYIVPISMLSVHWERYTLPIYAAGLLFGAFGVFYIVEDLQKVLNKKLIVSFVVYFILFLLPAVSLTAGGVAVCGSFLAPDSRILYQEMFAEMNVSSYNTIYDCNTPLDPGGYYGAFNEFVAGDPAQYKYGSSPKYVMTSSSQRDLYLAADPEVYGWIANFYSKLDSDYTLVCLCEVENPSSYFWEIQNIWYAARSIYRYMQGAATGYEIRLYQLVP